MTDKQIIIDGVDVSGCSYHYKHTRVCLVKMDAAGRYYNCANWHDCDFKKLSQKLTAKEQECERLKRQLTILDDEDVVVEITEKQFEEYKNLKQTLAEIRKIIHFNKTNRLSGGACISIEQILQKISDCEEGNELHSSLL